MHGLRDDDSERGYGLRPFTNDVRRNKYQLSKTKDKTTAAGVAAQYYRRCFEAFMLDCINKARNHAAGKIGADPPSDVDDEENQRSSAAPGAAIAAPQAAVPASRTVRLVFIQPRGPRGNVGYVGPDRYDARDDNYSWTDDNSRYKVIQLNDYTLATLYKKAVEASGSNNPPRCIYGSRKVVPNPPARLLRRDIIQITSNQDVYNWVQSVPVDQQLEAMVVLFRPEGDVHEGRDSPTMDGDEHYQIDARKHFIKL